MLSGLMRLAVDWRYVVENPVKRVKPFKESFFDFARNRRVEHYQAITNQTAAIPPPP